MMTEAMMTADTMKIKERSARSCFAAWMCTAWGYEDMPAGQYCPTKQKMHTACLVAAFICCLVLTVFMLQSPSMAAPALDRCMNAVQTRICPDNRDRSMWYIFPPAPEIALKEDGTPDYHLSLYHYAGRKGTGDEEKFWAKGIFTLNIVRKHQRNTVVSIRKLLMRRGIKKPKLRSIPISTANIKLVFGSSVTQYTSGTRWAGSVLTLPLAQDMAMVLANALGKGPANLTLMLDETVNGVKRNGKDWEEATIPLSRSLSIKLDPGRFPSNFSRTPLEREMDMAYTSIEVRSYDFQEQAVPDLYSETVEVAIKVPGGREVKAVQFRQGSEPVQTIRFSRAADLDIPYRVRVTCVLNDGRTIEGPWIEKRGEAFIDIHKCQARNISDNSTQ